MSKKTISNHPFLCFRYVSVLPPLFLRFNSVPKPFQLRSLEWAKNGTYMGVTRELHGTHERGIEIHLRIKILPLIFNKEIC